MTDNNINNDIVTIEDLAVMIKKELEVTKDFLTEKIANVQGDLRNEMNQGFSAIRNEMNQGFSAIRNEMNQGFSSIRAELASIRNELEEIKAQLNQAIKTEHEDTSAIGGDYFGLLQRVKQLETKVKFIEAQRA